MGISGLQSIMEDKNIDFSLFYSSGPVPNPNVVYFSGYKGTGILVVPRKRKPFLIAPKMEFERAKKSMVKNVSSMEKKRFFDSVRETIAKSGIKAKNIGIDKSSFTLNAYSNFKKQFKKIKAKDIAVDCLKLREIKTGEEIKLLKKSCRYADKILQNLIKNFKGFRKESEAAAFLEYETKKKGLELSFSPIVASGSNGSMPHHEPSGQKIKKGFCVIDFGVKHKNYCSDITRTIYVGKPSKPEKEIYSKLLAIQNDAINQAGLNKKCSELYDFAVKSLGKYSKNFTHGLGHGVGVEIHEMPNLTLNSKDKIRDNMVFTIEPGVYFPGKLGIRIEDTVLFRGKPIALTKTSKDLLII
ncbi:aminopeptidase P family protein [Candidatus Woesearchaeota archaeon]|nr:aminopeptidase P family protein [Candidatus Woesearchaeota archaeon]